MSPKISAECLLKRRPHGGARMEICRRQRSWRRSMGPAVAPPRRRLPTGSPGRLRAGRSGKFLAFDKKGAFFHQTSAPAGVIRRDARSDADSNFPHAPRPTAKACYLPSNLKDLTIEYSTEDPGSELSDSCFRRFNRPRRRRIGRQTVADR